MATAPPAKYVVYTHLGYRERDDFEAWRDGTRRSRRQGGDSSGYAINGRRATGDLHVVRHLKQHLPQLRRLLTSAGHEGVLVIFYAAGFKECLEGIAHGETKERLLQEHRTLRLASAIAKHVETEVLVDPELKTRVRFVTALDLFDVFGRMNWSTAINLRWWFIGSAGAIRYDTPKIVEAIIRLRLLGTGVPVFRVDHDVLFQGKENAGRDYLGVFQPIAACLQTYEQQRDEPSVGTFLFSASYDTSAIQTGPHDAGFAEWSRAFATRIFPALPVVPERLRKVDGTTYTWDHYAEDVFDEELARKFYGLDPDVYKSGAVAGIGKLGAHPLVSVISGALFCLSDGAILDLPPFSNFGLNVSWIDDHLKYSLHRELRHFTTVNRNVELSKAKLDTVMLTKARAPISNLPAYVLRDYLPTLLWGTVMDAWITPDPLLKYCPEDLPADTQTQWHQLRRRGRSQGILASALQAALEKGHIDRSEKQNLRNRLVASALARITEVRRDWAGLTNGGTETFASIWAKGTVSSYFPNLEPRCFGIGAPGSAPGEEMKTVFQLNHFLSDDFRSLLDDAIEYIDWTLHWPQIVQVVRSVEPGVLRVDLSWQPQLRE